MKETLLLSSYGHSRNDRVVEVEYILGTHWASRANTVNRRGAEWRSYTVTVDGEVIGTVEQVTESTDRKYNRIRIPGKGRMAWAWHATRKIAGRDRNYPGLYSRTRRGAVADMLGYGHARRIQ